MKIKICGIKYKDNLQDIIRLSPDFLGFNFYRKSVRYMADELSPDDLAMIPGSIKKTGIFVNQDANEISGLTQKYGLDYVQLHGNESAEMCKTLNNSGIMIIKAFSIHFDFRFEALEAYLPWCSFFLFDTATPLFGGSGKKFDWNLLEKYTYAHPFFLSGGIKPGDAENLLNTGFPSMEGVDVNSGFETEPGIKDVEKLKVFMKIIKNRI